LYALISASNLKLCGWIFLNNRGRKYAGTGWNRLIFFLKYVHDFRWKTVISEIIFLVISKVYMGNTHNLSFANVVP